MKVEQTECSGTSAYKIQVPGNYQEESIQHSEHGDSLKSRIMKTVVAFFYVTQKVCVNAECTWFIFPHISTLKLWKKFE